MTEHNDLDFLRRTSTIALGSAGPRLEIPSDSSRALERGASVGRYVVLDRVGGGGMGVVYAAYDPELDRKVALKLLRIELFESSEGFEARLRLLREAQALAKLSHPNVVAVHDVGTFEGQVFVAMEFIEGLTVNQWLQEEKRSWREVLGIFLQSGRGLAAAHEASLVHRDFKPSNVVVGGDGRVRVLDFGLAAPMDPALRLEDLQKHKDTEPELLQQSSALIAHLTQTGSTLGTPAYMAPEQHLGLGADMRSDQFSFCSALYEALYGQLPFSGADYREFANAVRRGKIREAPAGSGVPLWLRKVVLRGLDPDPEGRYPSMQELLQSLSQDPSLKWRRWLLGTAAVLALGGVLALQSWRERKASQLCQGAERKLEGIWDAERMEAIEKAFLATGQPEAYVRSTWRTSKDTLDEYADRWVRTHREACEATRIRGEHSEELLDLQMACLEDRRRGLRELTYVLGDANADVVGRAIDAVEGLDRLDDCINLELLQTVVKPPEDEETEQRVDEAQDAIRKAKAHREVGKGSEGLQLIRGAMEEQQDLQYSPVIASMNLELAQSLEFVQEYEEAASSLRLAQVHSDMGRHDVLRASILIEQVWIFGVRQRRYEVARESWNQAQAVIDRLGGDLDLQVRLDLAASNLKATEGEYVEAKLLAEAAMEGAGKLEDGGGASKYRSLEAYSRTMVRLGQAAEVVRNFGEIRDYWLGVGGPEHPDAVMNTYNLGVALDAAGEKDQAIASFEQALEIWEQTSGKNSPRLPLALSSLGYALRYKDPDRAFDLLHRALEIQNQIHPEGHPDVAIATESIGVVHWAQNQLSEAEGFLRESLALKEELWGERHPNLISTSTNVGRLLNAQGRFDEAFPFCNHSRELTVEAEMTESLTVGDALLCSGESRLGLGRLTRAIRDLEKAVAILGKIPGSDEFLADSQFSLAQALERAGGDPERISLLVGEARRGYREMGVAGKIYLERLEAWVKVTR